METYPAIQTVTLTAIPSAGFVFDRWSGQTEGINDLNQNPVSFPMGDRADNNRVMTAAFVPTGYPVWDINQDGKVNYKDLAILGAHYGQTTSPPYPAWDINDDGVVNYKDLAILGAHYGEVYSSRVCCSEPRPEICINLWDPVIGSDGQTYGNGCAACSNTWVEWYEPLLTP